MTDSADLSFGAWGAEAASNINSFEAFAEEFKIDTLKLLPSLYSFSQFE